MSRLSYGQRWLIFAPLVVLGLVGLIALRIVSDPAPVGPESTPTIAAMPTTPSARAASVQPARATPAGPRDDGPACTAWFGAYQALRATQDSDTVGAMALAKTQPAAGRAAALKVRASLVTFSAVSTAQSQRTATNEARVAIASEATLAQLVIGMIDKAGQDGTKISNIVAAAEWRALGQSALPACL
jgi:hypothetical protein